MFRKDKGAHDSQIAAAHRFQADALEIEAAAKRRLADEVDAGQERGEVAKAGQPSIIPEQNNTPTKLTDIGITAAKIHEARIFRDAELAEPGITKKTVTQLLDEGTS
ncbi:hypothetical protein [Bosea sp. PAMC 26642]|uniref:hypothetical protein n=1 Tax=Bosea sp. (strain PAMC 26642) TaxID=1792307 RepID=UPI00076FE0A5|nr:hypothetical protein [Bosea sp. PAMC 26642]AMJ60974.1 hypothetical protein AXW83_12290 [Bosea sp. PAMC 26642]